MAECQILSYGCSSAAGPSVQDFWRGLEAGVDHARQVAGYSTKFCVWPDESSAIEASNRDVLLHHLMLAWHECLTGLDESTRVQVRASRRLGVILASTKGCIEDEVWKESAELERDPLTPLLEAFIARAELQASDSICVSNACASSLAALFLGRQWLEQGRVDHVVILAADRPGRFVRRGFETLKILSSSQCRPFAQDRDGVVLGDAAAVLLLSRLPGDIRLESVATETEGHAVTRSEQSGESLRRACLATTARPDLVIAHGTGTAVNDQIEDQVLFSLYGAEVPITATKWSVGHTLGASAAMDVIAACEVLRRQKVFCVHNTLEVDHRFRSRILARKTEFARVLQLKQVLVTSLGFGGVHAAALLHKVERE